MRIDVKMTVPIFLNSYVVGEFDALVVVDVYHSSHHGLDFEIVDALTFDGEPLPDPFQSWAKDWADGPGDTEAIYDEYDRQVAYGPEFERE